VGVGRSQSMIFEFGIAGGMADGPKSSDRMGRDLPY
jgi:hypothetical protein